MDSAGRLRAAGLRVTGPRTIALDVLTAGGHFTADQIAARVRERAGAVSTQAVYDVLAALTKAGLARRIEPANSPALYEARVGDNHHHVVCRQCGSVADVDCAVGAAPCLTPGGLTPSAASGYVLDEAEVTFWGTCPACQLVNRTSDPTQEARP
jgi:Fur family ferric uptake transcriptional regulator